MTPTREILAEEDELVFSPTVCAVNESVVPVLSPVTPSPEGLPQQPIVREQKKLKLVQVNAEDMQAKLRQNMEASEASTLPVSVQT